MTLLGAGRPAEAARVIGRAIGLEGRLPEYHAQLARCFSVQRLHREALKAAAAALALDPVDPLTLDTIGVVFSQAGEHARAAGLYQRAVALRPDNAGFQYNLGAALRFLGRFDAAEAAFEAALALDPALARAHSALADLRRQTPERNHVARLRAQLAGTGDPAAELHLRYALAKELEDLGDYPGAFAELEQANRQQRASLRYDVADDEALFARVAELFTADLLNEPARGHRSREPIFVFGMPRTGTTLVERILSSHPRVFSAGELQDFGLVVKQAAATPSGLVLDEETLGRAVRVEPAVLGLAYLDSTRKLTGHTPHFVDKTPLNFFYAGLIHRALPDAPMVLLRRNPMDTCYSNYRQLFATGFSYYNYAWDLLDVGRYYLAFHRLMAHWTASMPGRILEIRYEDLVRDQERETRRLLEYCGLPWDEACLRFEENAAPVATASAAQVRQPIYRDAVERWRRYGPQLGPLERLLRGGGVLAG